MSEFADAIKEDENALEAAIGQAAGDDSRDKELLDALSRLAANGRGEQAELLAWAWLGEAAKARPPKAAADLAARLLLALPASGQIRDDAVALWRAAYHDAPDIDKWLTAAGLANRKVSPARCLRALRLVLGLAEDALLLDRHERRVVRVVRLDAVGGQVSVQPATGGAERAVDVLRLGDDYEPAQPDDFRVLADVDPQRLIELLESDPLRVLVGAVRAHGDRLDADQLRDLLTQRFLDDAKWAKWWSRARNAARKCPNLRIEGRMPAVLVYDQAGTTPEAEALGALKAAFLDPEQRLAVVENYLKQNSPPDPAFLADVAGQVDAWVVHPDATLADDLVAHRLAELGLPVSPPVAERARRTLATVEDVAGRIRALPSQRFWDLALSIVSAVRPVHVAPPASPVEGEWGNARAPDWQSIYLQVLPTAPAGSCDAIAAALIDAGQTDRLNAEIIAIVESPLESLDGLCWLWTGPARAGQLDIPPASELLSQLLAVAHRADQIAAGDPKLAKAVRTKVRGALSARGYARFAEHVKSLPAELAPMLRRQVRRCDGLGITVPERMLAVLDEHYPPVPEVRRVAPWLQEDVIYVSAEALAAKEKEQQRIINVEMPANAVAIGRAASHGDLSENSEYKFALEERDLLRARLARMNMELSMARVVHPQEVDTSHVSIYSTVQLRPLGPASPPPPAVDVAQADALPPAASPAPSQGEGWGEGKTSGPPPRQIEGSQPDLLALHIVSPWDSDAARRRYNYKAPLSQALLGRSVGQTVRLSFEGEPEADYRIEAILPPPTGPSPPQAQ